LSLKKHGLEFSPTRIQGCLMTNKMNDDESKVAIPGLFIKA